MPRAHPQYARTPPSVPLPKRRAFLRRGHASPSIDEAGVAALACELWITIDCCARRMWDPGGEIWARLVGGPRAYIAI
jgi:hypothetical protein